MCGDGEQTPRVTRENFVGESLKVELYEKNWK
jgi:hypothetical protein